MAQLNENRSQSFLQKQLQAAEERLYTLIQQKDTALSEYRYRVELSRATHGYFDPYHLEAEEWLDVAHSKWKQVEGLQRQYEQDGIKLIPRKPLTRLEEHQQQLTQSMQCPSGSTCSIPVLQSRARPAASASLVRRSAAAGALPTGTPKGPASTSNSQNDCQTTVKASATVLQVQAAGGTAATPCYGTTTITINSSSSSSSNTNSSYLPCVKQQPAQITANPTMTSAAAGAAASNSINSSTNTRSMSPLSSKPAPSRLSISSANDTVGKNAGSSIGGVLVSRNRPPLCLSLGTSVHADRANISNASAALPRSSTGLYTSDRVPHSVFPTGSNHAAAAVTSEHEHRTLPDAAPTSSTDNQITARHALLQHLGTQQQLLEAERQRAHNTSIPAALRELLLQPVLQVPGQIEQQVLHAPADLQGMLLKPGAAFANELQRQKLLHDLEAFRHSTSRMGATQTKRAKELYSTLMYSAPEEVHGGLWAKLCSVASSYRKQRQLTAERYRLADDLDVMFMRKKDGPQHYSDLRRLREWLCNQFPWRSMWCTIVLLWSTIFNTWLLVSGKHYSWCQRRRMAWTGYPSIIGQTRGMGALRQYYQNLDQRFVDDEPGHLGLTGLVKAGILPYLEDSTWTPIAIACRLQSAAAADCKWQHKVWQLEHPGVPFVYIDTPVSRPGAVWATEAWNIKPPAEEEDLQLARLVAEHGSTFSKRQLRTALAIFRGVDSAHFEYPTPTLLQLAQTHANSGHRAAATIAKALLDAEEEHCVTEIEQKQKEIHAFQDAEWMVWIQAIMASVPLLSRLMPYTTAQLLVRFSAIQQTKYRLEQQKEHLLRFSEGLMIRKSAKEPSRLLMHHLATHFTGGADPNVWLACQRRRGLSASGRLASVFGFGTASEFPAVNEAIAATAIRLSEKTMQLEQDMPYILGPNRTAEDLDEPQYESDSEGWWVALEELKQRMQVKHSTTSSAGPSAHQGPAGVAAAEQAPVVSAAALAAAKFTIQEAKAAVAAQAAAAKGHAAAITAPTAATSSSSTAPFGGSSRLPPRQAAAVGSLPAASSSAAAAAAAARAPTAAVKSHAASRHNRTAKHKTASCASRRGAGQEPSAAASARAAASSPAAAAAAANRGKTPAADPRAAATLTSPAKHACGPSRLGAGSAAAAAPRHFRSPAEHSSNAVVISSETLAGALQQAKPHGNRVPIPVTCVEEPDVTGICTVAVASASDSLKQSSSAAKQASASASTDDSCISMRDMLTAAVGELQEQSYSLNARQASFTKAVAAAAYVQNKTGSGRAAPAHSSGVVAPSDCAKGAPNASAMEADAISTSNTASFSGMEGLDSATAAAGHSGEQSLAEASLAMRQNSFNQVSTAAAAGVQGRTSSFTFGCEGKAAGKGSSPSYTSKPGSRESSFGKASNRSGKAGMVGIREPSFSGLAERAGSKEGSFSVSRVCSVITKGATRSNRASAADVEEAAEFAVDCSAASDLSLRYEGRVGAN